MINLSLRARTIIIDPYLNLASDFGLLVVCVQHFPGLVIWLAVPDEPLRPRELLRDSVSLTCSGYRRPIPNFRSMSYEHVDDIFGRKIPIALGPEHWSD